MLKRFCLHKTVRAVFVFVVELQKRLKRWSEVSSRKRESTALQSHVDGCCLPTTHVIALDVGASALAMRRYRLLTSLLLSTKLHPEIKLVEVI